MKHLEIAKNFLQKNIKEKLDLIELRRLVYINLSLTIIALVILIFDKFFYMSFNLDSYYSINTQSAQENQGSQGSSTAKFISSRELIISGIRLNTQIVSVNGKSFRNNNEARAYILSFDVSKADMIISYKSDSGLIKTVKFTK